MKVEWSLRAQIRLIEIEEHIALDKPVAAERFVERLVARGDDLKRNPNRGRLVPELPGSGLRELIVSGYRLIYRVHGKTVRVLTVFEGHRLIRPGELE